MNFGEHWAGDGYGRNDRTQRNADIVREYKKECADCGRNDLPPDVLELDHCRGEVKRLSSGRRVSLLALSLTGLWRELKKCDVVCPTCHKLREYHRGTFQRNELRGVA